MADNTVVTTSRYKPGAERDLDKLKKRFTDLERQGIKGFGIGIGAGVAVKGLSLIDNAMSAAIGFATDSVQAFMQEEESIARLGAALRANVKDWDGNADAIERVLASRMKLGFSDDEQRDSLALLTAATGDVTKALDIQRTAMDLARLKGIDLKTASEALVKVEAGQFRALKGLGIELRAGATATEALAAVQAVAKGQASAYADTLSGKVLTAQVKYNEAQERFGAAIAPAVSDGLTVLSDALDGIQVAAEVAADHGLDLGDAFLSIVNPALAATLRLQAATDASGDAATEFAILHRAAERASGSGPRAGIRSLGYWSEDSAEKIEELATKADAAAEKIIEEFFEPVALRGEEAELEIAVREATKELKEAEDQAARTGKRIDRDLVEVARGKLANLQADLLRTRSKLIAIGDPDARAAVIHTLDKIDAKGDKTLDGLISDAKRAIGLMDRLDNYLDWLVDFRISEKAPLFKAAGGPVSPHVPYIVGEQGPELMVPQTAGTIVPNGKLGAAGGVVLNVNIGDFYGTEQNIYALSRRLAEVTRESLVRR